MDEVGDIYHVAPLVLFSRHSLHAGLRIGTYRRAMRMVDAHGGCARRMRMRHARESCARGAVAGAAPIAVRSFNNVHPSLDDASMNAAALRRIAPSAPAGQRALTRPPPRAWSHG